MSIYNLTVEILNQDDTDFYVCSFSTLEKARDSFNKLLKSVSGNYKTNDNNTCAYFDNGNFISIDEQKLDDTLSLEELL